MALAAVVAEVVNAVVAIPLAVRVMALVAP